VAAAVPEMCAAFGVTPLRLSWSHTGALSMGPTNRPRCPLRHPSTSPEIRTAGGPPLARDSRRPGAVAAPEIRAAAVLHRPEARLPRCWCPRCWCPFPGPRFAPCLLPRPDGSTAPSPRPRLAPLVGLHGPEVRLLRCWLPQSARGLRLACRPGGAATGPRFAPWWGPPPRPSFGCRAAGVLQRPGVRAAPWCRCRRFGFGWLLSARASRRVCCRPLAPSTAPWRRPPGPRLGYRIGALHTAPLMRSSGPRFAPRPFRGSRRVCCRALVGPPPRPRFVPRPGAATLRGGPLLAAHCAPLRAVSLAAPEDRAAPCLPLRWRLHPPEVCAAPWWLPPRR
jgi:hypothetical protein